MAPAFGAPRATEFAPYDQYVTGSWPESVTVGDVTGDGRNDVLLTTSSYFDPERDFKLFVFAQQPDGSLALAQKLSTHGARGDPMGVAAGDLDGDRRTDAVVATLRGVDVLYQNDSGALSEPQLIRNSPRQASQVLVTDLNSDGRDDLVVNSTDRTEGNEEENPTTIPGKGIVALLKDAVGLGFSRRVVSTQGVDEVEVGDLNSDGRLDVVALTGKRLNFLDYGVRIYHQLADGSYEPAPSLGPYQWVAGLAVEDLTADGRDDLAVTHTGMVPNTKVAVHPQLPDATIDADPALYDSYNVVEPIDSWDVNGDGRVDLVVLHGGWNAAGLYLQTEDATLGDEILFDIPYASHYNAKGLVLGDVSGDSLPDVVIADYNSGLIVLRQKPPPNAPPECSGVGAAPTTLFPPNRRFATITLQGVHDPDGDPVTLTITGVTQDEPVAGKSGATSPDAAPADASDRVRVRAERDGKGDGRVYRIAFTASDDRGATCSGTANVTVPRKQKRPAVDSAPPSYNSFG